MYKEDGFVSERKKVNGPKKKESKSIFGALNMKSQRFYWKQADKGTSKVFIAFLHQLHQSFPKALLAIILDNSSIHKSKKVKRFLKNNSWVKLHFLTPYSPEYNPIERFGKWLKSKVYASKSFKNIDEVISKIRRIIWHRHENRLVGKINMNFNAYNEIL